MFSTVDTIVAVATPPGHGGLGVVRISGDSAREIAGHLLKTGSLTEPRRAVVTRFIDPDARAARSIDHVVATWFRAPHSYTREDVVEISAHGSPAVLQQIVTLAVRAGARLAEPGEFTYRAYLHGRIDLVQAEAVADLIDAVTPRQARSAMDQLEGTLTARIAAVSERLFDLSARLEASIDFPEEGFHFVDADEAANELDGLVTNLRELSAEGRTGRVLREGALVVIAGPPNVGKSSLFNALAGADRAIVADEPGTTRDMVTERVAIGGVPITLVDTAGLRATAESVEGEGIRRARQATEVAALTLFVVDGSRPAAVEDLEGYPSAGRRLVVANKSDRGRAWQRATAAETDDVVVFCSALTGEGIGQLEAQVVAALAGGDALRDTPAISNIRHLALVGRAQAAIERAAHAARAGETEEVLLVEIVEARRALEELTGVRTDEDVLRHIFGRFCIGK